MFWKSKPKPNFVRPEFGALFFFDEKRFSSALANKQMSTDRDDILDIFRRALQSATEHMKARFNEGEEIHKLIKDRSNLIDHLLYYAWVKYEWDEGIALCAVGGYGRGEMHPHSDLDLLFLLRKDNPEKYKQSISDFLTFLWDLQLTIGHSVRTAKQCASSAASDVTIMTNLIESRVIIGPMDLEETLKEQADKVWPASEFFNAKMTEQAERHSKHGITEFDLEPNVKESPGGLRDIQTIDWVVARAYKVTGLEKLAGEGICNEQEYHSLKAAETFLWRVRFGLHTLSNRPKEQLDFESQRLLASMFGYKDTPQRLAVEQFMQRYYRSASVVREITDVLTQLLREKLDNASAQNITPINERFQLRGRYIETCSPEIYKSFPSAILETFVILSQDKTIEGVHGETIRQLREYSHLIDESFRENTENRQLFVDLLKSPNHLSIPLQLMSRYSILGKYLPEFGSITGLTQHDLFHIYPVDIHTMAVVRNIRNFGLPEARKQYPVSSYAYASFPKHELLVVAGLYHDIGKGRGGDHSELGAVDAEIFARNHGFSERETKLIVWLVQNHLFMSRVAQREDTSDPEVINSFAKHVKDETRLNLLYTLTTADILATNPTLWNNWRASLMRQLYYNTRNLLRRGLENVVERQELIQDTQQEAVDKLKNAGIESNDYAHYWQDLGESYFLREAADDIVWHTKLLLEPSENDNPLVRIKPFVHYDRERATVAFIRAKKSPSLFYSAATAIGNSGLSIQDARLYETRDANFLTLYILDANSEPLNDDSQRLDRLKTVLTKELDVTHGSSGIIEGRTPRQLKQFPVKTTTHFSIEHGQSVLEVITADRSGLLATIAEMFLKNNVILKSARITTLGERVEDLFVLENRDGSPLQDDEACKKLQQDIRETIDEIVVESTNSF